MKNMLTLILASVIFSCTGRDVQHSAEACDSLVQGSKSFVRLAKPGEPGEPLIISGKILDKQTNFPIKNASVVLYQTDSSGNYNSWLFGYPPFAKIRGRLVTGESGCFKIQTILPGDYPGAIDNKHIHFKLKAKGYEMIRKEFLFEGFLNDEMREYALRDNSGIILNITKNKQGIRIAAVNLYLTR